MKLNLLTLIFCIIPSLFFGQILEENFDDITDLESKGWIISNQSSPTGMIDWFQGNTAVFDSHNGEANAYIASNYNSVDNFGTISNWLITPTVSVRDGDVLSFWTRTSTGSTWNDRLEVRSSQGAMTLPSGATDVGSFTNVMLIINDDYDLTYPDYWIKYELEITNVGDEPVDMNFAFRYNVVSAGNIGDNSNYIGIDTVLIIDNYVPEPGCLDAPNGVFPADTFTPSCNGLEEIITSDAKTGQYSNVNVTVDEEYIFSSSASTDYIIISDESGENILAEGFSPLTWIQSKGHTERIYLLLDDECNFSDEIRQKIVQCGEEEEPEPGCLDAPNGVFPADTFTPNCNGLEEIITSDAQTGQYSNVNVIANDEYIFSSSVTTDYIIVSDESGENILAEGFSPLTWTPSADQTVRFYLLLDDECNFSDEIRQKIVQCGEEEEPEPGCLDAPNGVFPADTFTPSCNGLEEIITSDAQTGQYSNVNVIANDEYIFSSSVTTDYIIVSDESGENILAEGFSPLTWTPSADQTVRFYLLLDDECNFSDEIRQKIVQCGEEEEPEPGCLDVFRGVFPADTFTPSCNGLEEIITSDAQTGQYSNVNVIANDEYIFSSSVTTDYIIVSDESGENILAEGFSPLT